VPLRLAGADRIATAIAISQSTWGGPGASRQAQSVVIAADDAYPDALAAVPLAAAKQAPLLFTGSADLDVRVAAELSRILAPGSTIYVVGGTAVLSPRIDKTLSSAGYGVVRIAGSDRFATAVAIANALGNPSTVFEASGDDVADALAAGPAAAATGGAVLLTDGSHLPSATAIYVRTYHPTVYSVGGPAAHADPSATPIVGADRYATAAAVAAKFFSAPTVAGFVAGNDYPDALAAGAQLAQAHGPLLLVGTNTVPVSTSSYLAAHLSVVAYVYGGEAAVGELVTDVL